MILQKLEKLEAGQAKLDRIEEDIRGIKGDVQGLKNGQERMETDIRGLKDNVQGLKDSQAKLEAGQKVIQKDTANINKHIEKGVYVDLERVKERVTRLEQKII